MLSIFWFSRENGVAKGFSGTPQFIGFEKEVSFFDAFQFYQKNFFGVPS